MKRRPVPPIVRLMIHRRDMWTCRHCGRNAIETKLHIDHILPIALGGNNLSSNLQTLCMNCNLQKGARFAG